MLQSPGIGSTTFTVTASFLALLNSMLYVALKLFAVNQFAQFAVIGALGINHFPDAIHVKGAAQFQPHSVILRGVVDAVFANKLRAVVAVVFYKRGRYLSARRCPIGLASFVFEFNETSTLRLSPNSGESPLRPL